MLKNTFWANIFWMVLVLAALSLLIYTKAIVDYPKPLMLPVVVAIREIPVNATINPGMVAVRRYDKSKLPSRAVAVNEFESVFECKTTKPFSAGEPLSWRFVTKTKGKK